MKKLFRNLGPVLGTASITLMLSFTACDRPANSGGTADDPLQHTQGAGLNFQLDTNKLDRARDKIRDGLTNAARDVGRGLERAGQEIQGAVTGNPTNH